MIIFDGRRSWSVNGDDNVDDHQHQQHLPRGVAAQIERETGLVPSGGTKWAPAPLIMTQGAGLPPRDTAVLSATTRTVRTRTPSGERRMPTSRGPIRDLPGAIQGQAVYRPSNVKSHQDATGRNGTQRAQTSSSEAINRLRPAGASTRGQVLSVL